MNKHTWQTMRDLHDCAVLQSWHAWLDAVREKRRHSLLPLFTPRPISVMAAEAPADAFIQAYEHSYLGGGDE